MNILLTGATGFLGSHLSRALQADKHTVVHAVGHYGRDSVKLWMSHSFFDAVVHCAGIYGRQGESAAQMLRVNTLLTVELFEAAQKSGVRRFIYTNTALPRKLNAYSQSKHQAADWLEQLADKTEVICLKIQHMYGPGARDHNFITSIFKQCLANQPTIDLTEGQQRRDFVYISDVVDAIVRLLKSPVKNGFHNFEIGSGESPDLRFLVNLIAEMTGANSQLNFGMIPYRPLEPMLMRASVADMLRLGCERPIAILEGLNRTLAAMKEGQ